jgi:hypothetical protein
MTTIALGLEAIYVGYERCICLDHQSRKSRAYQYLKYKERNMDYEAEDKTGLYLVNERPIIKSVSPTEGKEGDIITIKGKGFSEYIRNNCIVVGGMGACARAQSGSTSAELKVRIDPVSHPSEGEILAWVGAGSNFYNETIGFRSSQLRFSETAIGRAHRRCYHSFFLRII